MVRVNPNLAYNYGFAALYIKMSLIKAVILLVKTKTENELISLKTVCKTFLSYSVLTTMCQSFIDDSRKLQ